MNSFVGTWRLLSFEERGPDGSSVYPYGENPVGLLMYDAGGHLSVQIMSRNRTALSSGNVHQAESAEIKSAVEGFTAFFGTYQVDEERQVVTHHVDGHVIPNSVGKDLKRRFEFSGDRLILKPSEDRTLTWQRA